MEYNQTTFAVIGAVCAVGITIFKMAESLKDTPIKPKKNGGTRKNRSRK